MESCAKLTAEGEPGRPGYLRWANATVIPGASIHSPADLANLPRPAIVRDVDLKGADLSGVDLGGLCFDHGDLSHTRWRKADDSAVNEVDLTGADMHRASMRRAFIIDSTLRFVIADHARFGGATIAGGEPSIDLSYADLRGAVLRCGMTIGDYMCNWVSGDTDARGADLADAAIFNFPLSAWQLDSARLNRTTIGLAELPKFASAKAVGWVTIIGSGYGVGSDVRISATDFRLLAKEWSAPRRWIKPSLAQPKWLRPGVKALFVDSDGASTAFRRTSLYHRLLPVILASAFSTLSVQDKADGRIAVLGRSLGANGHECSIDNEGDEALTLDPHTGWFELPTADLDPDGNGDRRLIRLSDDIVEIAQPQYGCPATRAGWSSMRRVPDDSATRRVIASPLGQP